jgi:ABC-type transport system involved in Fe-S cluster assembly fused permease/ATPase subunit
LTTSLLIAARRVGAGTMSVGDLVAVNSMLLQLSIPFNFMGFTCKHSTPNYSLYIGCYLSFHFML